MLSKPDLVKETSFIDGLWAQKGANNQFDVVNPATGETIASVSDLDEKQVHEAIDAAVKALPKWQSATAAYRSGILMNWYRLVLANLDDLALLMTLEQGKPLSESRAEINYAASFIEWFAEEGKRTYGDVIPSPNAKNRIITLKQAVGVVAAITPWNFPSAMITRKIAPALAAGCTAVVKPSEHTPLSALALAYLASEAGLPPGVLNVLTVQDPLVFSNAVMRRKEVRKVTFTGSTRVGKLVMKAASDSVKRVSLELGGNAPFIVFEDADIDAAVAGAMASKYRNAGQTCVCSNRIFVHESIMAPFVERFKRNVQALQVGDGTEEKTDVGPLINRAAVEKIEGLLKDAVEKGATLEWGGHKHAKGGTFFEPTIVCNLDDSMRMVHEEIFGPISCIYSFSTEQEVVQKANQTSSGLAAYFYTNDLSRSWRVSESLEYGMIGINTGLISTAVAPFGGIKESGLGREGSKYGIDEYLETKYVCIGAV